MKILLIRHGETVDNVAGIYAGTLDSSLTNHGHIQVQKLGEYLQREGYQIQLIFSSDLQRAYLTAQAIKNFQSPSCPSIICLSYLREKDFGPYEGTKISNKVPNPTTLDKEGRFEKSLSRKIESKKALDDRADSFIDNNLSSILCMEDKDYTVAIVSHGIFLGHLWRTLLKRISPVNISLHPLLSRTHSEFNLKYLGNWSNTGFLEFSLTKGTYELVNETKSSPDLTLDCDDEKSNDSPKHCSQADIQLPELINSVSSSKGEREKKMKIINHFLHSKLEVKAIDSKDHLIGLQKLRGGTGNLKHNPMQKTIETYFEKQLKKQKLQ